MMTFIIKIKIYIVFSNERKILQFHSFLKNLEHAEQKKKKKTEQNLHSEMSFLPENFMDVYLLTDVEFTSVRITKMKTIKILLFSVIYSALKFISAELEQILKIKQRTYINLKFHIQTSSFKMMAPVSIKNLKIAQEQICLYYKRVIFYTSFFLWFSNKCFVLEP